MLFLAKYPVPYYWQGADGDKKQNTVGSWYRTQNSRNLRGFLGTSTCYLNAHGRVGILQNYDSIPVRYLCCCKITRENTVMSPIPKIISHTRQVNEV